MLHQPAATSFNDAILTTGAAYWTRLERYLEALRAPGPGCARGPSRTRRPGRCGVTAPSRCTQQPATQVRGSLWRAAGSAARRRAGRARCARPTAQASSGR
jgi:hypothetical protein